jgi:hypothetical protein
MVQSKSQRGHCSDAARGVGAQLLLGSMFTIAISQMPPTFAENRSDQSIRARRLNRRPSSKPPATSSPIIAGSGTRTLPLPQPLPGNDRKSRLTRATVVSQ